MKKGNKQRWSYVYSPDADYAGMLESELPSFWKPGLSKLFGADSTPATFRRDPETTRAVISGEPARLMGLKGEPAPRLDALATSFAMLSEGYAELPDMNPLTLWDLRYVLELEEHFCVAFLPCDVNSFTAPSPSLPTGTKDYRRPPSEEAT